MATSRLPRALLLGALLARIFLPLARADHVEVDAGDVPVDVESGVQQIHMAQGKDPTSMVISWLTPDASQPAPASQVRYGLSSDALTMAAGNNNAYTYTIPAGYAKPPMKSPYPLYTSGWLHNVELTGLQPDTLYFYQVGDFSLPPSNATYPTGIYTPPAGRSGTLTFRTLPAPGKLTRKDKSLLRFGVVADIGQNPDAERSVLRLSQSDTDLLIFAGDEGYADCVGKLWDTFLNMLTGVTSFVPMMVAAGNHEIEWLSNATSLETQVFMSYEKRFKMPQVQPAIITSAPNPLTFDPSQKLCAPSKYQAGYEWGNSYFSYVAGPVLFIHLNPYSYTNTSSLQYAWLQRTLQSVDRKVTPWVLAVYHNPWYNSNREKQNEFETLGMQAAFEPLFKAYGVNFVLNGHVHAYERSFPVYQFNPTPDAPAYVVVGTGADSVHDNVWLNETSAPAWSAYRNATQWGTGTLEVASEKKLTWQWHWNLDGILVAADEVTICNTALGYPTYCEGLQFQCTLRLRGASKATWTAQSAQRLVNLTSAATGVAASQLLVRKPALPRTKKARMLGGLLAAEAAAAEAAAADEGKSEGRGTLRMEWAGDKTAAGVRGGGMRVVLEAFGLPGTKKGDTTDDAAAARATAHAIESYLKTPAFVAAFGQGVSAASASCSKPRFGTAKL